MAPPVPPLGPVRPGVPILVVGPVVALVPMVVGLGIVPIGRILSMVGGAVIGVPRGPPSITGVVVRVRYGRS